MGPFILDEYLGTTKHLPYKTSGQEYDDEESYKRKLAFYLGPATQLVADPVCRAANINGIHHIGDAPTAAFARAWADEDA